MNFPRGRRDAVVLSAKIEKPLYGPAIVDRTRLYRRLDRWRGFRAAVIHAPAGYGKSTLVSRWIDVSGLADTSSWLSLDEGDSDPRRLIRDIVASIEGCAPGVCAAVEPALRDRYGSVEQAAAGLLAVLEDALESPPRGRLDHVLLILDNAQRIDSPQVRELVQRLVEYGPSRLHLLLLTRNTTDLPLARLHAQGRILDLGKADLSFTEDEVRALLHARGFRGATADEVTQLTRRSEGWVTALQLGMLSLGESGGVPDLVQKVRGDRDWLARFLDEEVLDNLAPAVRLFMLRTSILEEFDAGLCTAVTGMDDAAAKLAAIARADLFLVELDSRRGWFRYHELFRELLYRRMKELVSEGEVAALHHRAGAQLAFDGQLEPALRHLLAAGAEDEAADLAERHIGQTARRDPFAAMRLLDVLAADVWRQRPQLSLEHCKLAMIMDDPDTGRYVEEAAELFETRGVSLEDSPALLGTLSALRSAAALITRDMETAAVHLGRALPHVADLDDVTAGTAWFIQMYLCHFAGDYGCLPETSARALAGFTRADFLIGSVAVQRQLARWKVERGESHEAARHFTALLESLPSDRPEIVHEQWWLTAAAAENSYWQDDLERAREYQRATLSLAHRLQDESLIRCSHAMGAVYDPDGRTVYEPTWELHPHHRGVSPQAVVTLLADLDVRCLVASGRGAEAWELAQHIGIDPTDPSAVRTHQRLLAYLRAAIARGVDLSGLTPLLKGATAHHAKRGTRFVQLQLMALTAWQQVRLRQRQRALATLGQAAGLARETGYVRALLDVPELGGLLARVDRPLGSAARRTAAATDRAGLTIRERQILESLAADRTYGEIAEELVLSINTVRTHVRHLYRKLSVRRRAEAVAAAHRFGILSDRRRS